METLAFTTHCDSYSFADFVLQLTTSTVLRVVANGRNRRRCILAPPVYHSPVYSPQKSSSSSLWLPLSYISGRLPLFITLLYIPPKSPHHQTAAVYHSPVYSTKSAITTNIFNLTINLRIINFHPCYHYYHHISAAGRNCLSPSNILHCAAYYARLYITITLQTNNCKHTQHNMKVPT